MQVWVIVSSIFRSFYLFISFIYFFCLPPGYPEPSPQPAGMPQHSHQSPLHGRVSVTESYHAGHADYQGAGHSDYQHHEHVYGNNGHYENNYGTYYDPNITNNSVFEDSGHGLMTPLPGTLGSVSHTPLPREAPRAVFDEDHEQEPGQGQHPMFAPRPKSSVGSVQQPAPGLCSFCFLHFSHFHSLYLSFSLTN